MITMIGQDRVTTPAAVAGGAAAFAATFDTDRTADILTHFVFIKERIRTFGYGSIIPLPGRSLLNSPAFQLILKVCKDATANEKEQDTRLNLFCSPFALRKFQ